MVIDHIHKMVHHGKKGDKTEGNADSTTHAASRSTKKDNIKSGSTLACEGDKSTPNSKRDSKKKKKNKGETGSNTTTPPKQRSKIKRGKGASSVSTPTVGKPGDPYVRRNPVTDIPILSWTAAAPAG